MSRSRSDQSLSANGLRSLTTSKWRGKNFLETVGVNIVQGDESSSAQKLYEIIFSDIVFVTAFT